MSRRLILIAVGIAVTVWIVNAGGPTERLTYTWVVGLRTLTVGVIVAEIVTRLLKRRDGNDD